MSPECPQVKGKKDANTHLMGSVPHLLGQRSGITQLPLSQSLVLPGEGRDKHSRQELWRGEGFLLCAEPLCQPRALDEHHTAAAKGAQTEGEAVVGHQEGTHRRSYLY